MMSLNNNNDDSTVVSEPQYQKDNFDEFDTIDDSASDWLAELKHKNVKEKEYVKNGDNVIDVDAKNIGETKIFEPYTPRNYNPQTLNSQVYSSDLDAIRLIEPNLRISKIQDVPNFTKFAQYRAKGYDTNDAYFLANSESIINKKVLNVKQAVQNTYSKDHLKTFGGSAGKSSDYVDIPLSQLNFYREAFPDDTPEKLKIRYNKIRKRQGDY